MIHTSPRTNLGLLPVVIGVAVGLETAWAWFDPDIFNAVWLEADQEQQVISLNNWWVGLEETGHKTLAADDPVWDLLYANIEGFLAWRRQYNDAILRRWLPGGRDWDAELAVWFTKFRETSARVAEAGGREAERELERRGMDLRLLPQEDKNFLEQTKQAIADTIEKAGEAAGKGGEGVGAGLLWPALALGASAGLLIFLATREPPRRKRRAA